MDYTIASIAPIILLPFFAFVINAFIVKRATKLAVAISCGSIIGSFIFAARIFSDFVFNVYSKDYYIHKVFNWIDISYGTNIFKIDLGIYRQYDSSDALHGYRCCLAYSYFLYLLYER